MKLEQNYPSVTTGGFEEIVQFRTSSTNKGFRLLTKDLYVDKPTAIVRELLSNAFDAVRYTENSKVQISFDTINSRLTIADNGCGISYADLKEVYTVLFNSPKDQDNTDIGAYGLGAKIPLSYHDCRMDVTTAHRGEMIKAVAYMDGDQPQLGIFERTASSETGTTVSFSYDPEDLESMYRYAVMFLLFNDNLTVERDGDRVTKQDLHHSVNCYSDPSFFLILSLGKKRFGKTGDSTVATVNNIIDTSLSRIEYIVDGNIPYLKEGFTYSPIVTKAVPNFQIGEVNFSLSREQIDSSSDDVVNQRRKDMKTLLSNKLNEIQFKNFAEFFSTLDDTEAPSYPFLQWAMTNHNGTLENFSGIQVNGITIGIRSRSFGKLVRVPADLCYKFRDTIQLAHRVDASSAWENHVSIDGHPPLPSVIVIDEEDRNCAAVSSLASIQNLTLRIRGQGGTKKDRMAAIKKGLPTFKELADKLYGDVKEKIKFQTDYPGEGRQKTASGYKCRYVNLDSEATLFPYNNAGVLRYTDNTASDVNRHYIALYKHKTVLYVDSACTIPLQDLVPSAHRFLHLRSIYKAIKYVEAMRDFDVTNIESYATVSSVVRRLRSVKAGGIVVSSKDVPIENAIHLDNVEKQAKEFKQWINLFSTWNCPSKFNVFAHGHSSKDLRIVHLLHDAYPTFKQFCENMEDLSPHCIIRGEPRWYDNDRKRTLPVEQLFDTGVIRIPNFPSVQNMSKAELVEAIKLVHPGETKHSIEKELLKTVQTMWNDKTN